PRLNRGADRPEGKASALPECLQRTASEDIAEHDVEVTAIAAVEAGVDAPEDTLGRVEPDAESPRVFEPPQIEIAAAHGHLAGVVEEGGVEPRPDLETVFGLQCQSVRTAEPVVAKATERVVPAKRRHQIEGHAAASVGLRRRGEQTHRKDPAFGKHAGVLAQVDVCASEVEGTARVVKVAEA